jgi:thiamine-phosphate pyrophosphorylase
MRDEFVDLFFLFDYTWFMFDAVVDANVNRVSEGLRVVEEYVRFVRSNVGLTQRLSVLRKRLNGLFSQTVECLRARSTEKDVRSKEVPLQRQSIEDVLVANFKRVEEGLRVLEEYTGSVECNAMRYDVYDLESEIILLAKKPLIKRGVYLISDDPQVIAKGVSWGCALVQLRDKGASKEVVYNKAKEVVKITAKSDVPFILNDYIDIAMLVEADGVHTGQDDIDVSDLIRLWGKDKLYGRTTHSLDQGRVAVDHGVDYISVGPIWDTPSKPGRAGIGFDYLKEVRQLGVPFVAIGGINDDNLESVMAYSPDMVGVIRSYSSVPEWQSRYFS